MKAFNKITAVILAVGIVIGSLGVYAALPAEEPLVKPLVAPEELDSYYAFVSGGKGGDIRVVGLPSLRVLRLIPVFQPSAQYGYAMPAADNTTTMLRNTGKQDWGITMDPVLSKTAGDYDGRWLFVQDARFGRVAKVDLKVFETEEIKTVPNMALVKGLSVDPDTSYLAFYGETKEGEGALGLLDPETLTAELELIVPGKVADLVWNREGSKLFFAFKDNGSPKGAIAAVELSLLEDMAGKAAKQGGVPIVSWSELVPQVQKLETPVALTNLNLNPAGKYLLASGRESEKLLAIDAAAFKLLAEVNIGPEPVNTTFDARGIAYTGLYGKSKVIKWDMEKALAGEKEYLLEEIAVHYNPEYVQIAGGETSDPDGNWLLALNDHARDRFLDVGADLHNLQLISIQEDGLKIIKDGPMDPDPANAVLVKAEKLQANETFIPGEEAVAEGESRLERTGPNSVNVYMTVKRSEFGLHEFRVKEGDQVTLSITNIERVKDITHGFALSDYNINLSLPPGKTVTLTFTADKPGVYWYYCTIFCSALHLEMAGRMIVEPR